MDHFQIIRNTWLAPKAEPFDYCAQGSSPLNAIGSLFHWIFPDCEASHKCGLGRKESLGDAYCLGGYTTKNGVFFLKQSPTAPTMRGSLVFHGWIISGLTSFERSDFPRPGKKRLKQNPLRKKGTRHIACEALKISS